MFKKVFAGTLAAASIMAVAGCPALNSLIPPIPVKLPAQSVSLKEIWKDAPASGETIIPQFPTSGYVQIPPATSAGGQSEGFKIDVPADAKDKLDKIDSATLDFKIKNDIGAPVKIQVFLAKSAPFAAQPLTTLDIAATGESTGSAKLDAALLKESELRLGFGASTPGTGGKTVTVSSSSKLTVEPTLILKLKLL